MRTGGSSAPRTLCTTTRSRSVRKPCTSGVGAVLSGHRQSSACRTGVRVHEEWQCVSKDAK
eukprot:2798706-Pyramimonas_sp.AAC.1